MIKELLLDEVIKKKLSARAAAKEIGVAHTTLLRFLDDKQVDLETLQKICDWLGVNVGLALNLSPDKNADIVAKVACILQKNSVFRGVFNTYYDEVGSSDVNLQDIEEILEFMLFKISYRSCRISGKQ